LIPSPQLRFEGVRIGENDAVTIARARATPEFGTVFTDRKLFRSVELEGLKLSPAAVTASIWGSNITDALRILRITARGLRLEMGGLALPSLDIEAIMTGEGAVQSITLTNNEQKLLAKIEPGGRRAKVEMSAEKLALPFGTSFVLQDFAGKGTLTPAELSFAEFEARAFEGYLGGNARLRWGQAWSLEGDLGVRQVDVAKIAGPLLASGRLEGSFTIQKGSIANVDMTQALQGSASTGGATLFS